jgi:hypothetical protein
LDAPFGHDAVQGDFLAWFYHDGLADGYSIGRYDAHGIAAQHVG